MRPQGFGGQAGSGLEDLGWNDMGFEPPKAAEVERDEDHDAFGEDVVEHPRAHPTGLTPVGSPVHDQQAEIVERFNGEEEAAGEIDEEFDETAEPYESEAAQVDETAEPYESEAAQVDEIAEPYEAEVEEVREAPEIVAAPVIIPSPAPRRAPRSRAA